ncbi:signal protein [Streptosporangium nondiastaticum]|nr:signal protein [Streptosporangium nondiastaticum]
MRIGRPVAPAALLLGAALLAAGCAGTPAPKHADAKSTPNGGATATAAPDAAAGPLTPSDLQGRWWTWASSSPSGSNPVEDRDGSMCAQGQKDGGVWFLAGTFGERAKRTCAVPANRRLAFPLVNLMSDQAGCSEFMAPAKGTATLDGKPLRTERYDATPVRVTAEEGNPLTDGGGTFRTHACGLWVQTEPLKPGNHTLEIRGSSGRFAVSVDYTLKVPAAGAATNHDAV